MEPNVEEQLTDAFVPENQEQQDALDNALSLIPGDPVTEGTISAPAIESATPFNIPEAPTPQIADEVISGTVIPPENIEAPETTQETPEVSGELQDLFNEFKEKQGIFQELGLGGITDTFNELMKKGAFTASAEESAGIDEKTIAFNDINSELRETDLRFRREREDLADATGMTAGFKQQSLNRLGAKQARTLADLSIIKATRRDDLSTAQALVDRKVALHFEPLEQKLQYQTFLFEQNKALFTQAEERAFQKKVRAEQVQIDKDKFKFQALENLKVEQMMNVQANGGTNEQMKEIQRATTPEGVFKAAGSMGMSLQDRMAKLELGDLMSSSSGGNLTDKQRSTLAKDKTAQQTGALISVDNLLSQYEQMIKGFGKSPSRKQRKQAQAFVTNLVAPSLAVANGQGAMTDDEREAILDDIGLKGVGRREKITFGNVSSVLKGLQTKINTNFDFIDSSMPGASDNFEIFNNYKISNLDGSDFTSAVQEQTINTFKSQNFSDTQILEYYLGENETASELLLQGYSLSEIINSLQ